MVCVSLYPQKFINQSRYTNMIDHIRKNLTKARLPREIVTIDFSVNQTGYFGASIDSI